MPDANPSIHATPATTSRFNNFDPVPNESTNRLRHSASPYLRSAAHQPVDWHEWGEEAFQKARAESKPILLDVGAVWCHWCHVIDRESYENSEIAALINRNYIPVKVDRDERPDVDSRYQSAISAISGQGGWPLTAFLTPEGKPFWGGTYFPPEDMMGRPGFKRILLAVAEAFQSRRTEIDGSAQALEEAVAKAEVFDGARAALDAEVVDTIISGALRLFDETRGGFGQAPKFPHSSVIDLLLERRTGPAGANLHEIAKRTLDGMAAGGFHDQLGGGFHRYSVDERWCVPHFEKMSYDNSELLKNYLHGYQALHLPRYREVAEGIVSWVNEVLSDQQRGGFYASQDADQTLDDDGDYFTWTQAEVRAALTPEESRAIEIYYDVHPHGEMHHNPEKNVLWISASLEMVASALKISEADARLLLARAKGKLLDARRRRHPTPGVDDTLYVAWNAMFVSAYLEAARVLKRVDCRAFGLKTLDRLLAEAWDESKGFLHRAGGPRLDGSLDDQVFAAAALLDAYEVTLDRRYFDTAERCMRVAIERFGDPDAGGFFDRAKDAAAMGGLEVRRKALQDSPTPGANAVAAIVLDRLYAFTGERFHHDWAEKTLEAFAGRAPQYGIFAATYGLAVLLHKRGVLQVIILGAANDPKSVALESAANEVYRFAKSVLRISPVSVATASLASALRETLPHLDAAKPQALVCVETTCYPPVADPAELASFLATIGTDSANAARRA
ncbi:MAG TPA: thioredoxin domain-containing protein [Candidatus Acidoferrales bacterium]|nr:thioredoxin domain-containing protein [Candidatus Acidoferrales bacterium]